MNDKIIAFLGAGNMASSIIGGLMESGLEPDKIVASDPYAPSLNRLKQRYRVRTTSSNRDAVGQADTCIIAVKPQILASVCAEVAPHLPPATMTLSIAAGINTRSIAQYIGDHRPIVRCMPNTPALVKQGASVLFANSVVTKEQKNTAQAILAAVGSVHWIDEENLLDAVTAVSGSGPAYFLLVMEAMRDAGVKLGLDKNLATQLAMQTAYGTALLAISSTEDVRELRRAVTSPNGTTEQAIQAFENNNIRDIFMQAMSACAEKSHELGKLCQP